MSDFQPSNQQGEVLELLVRLIGLSGIHKRPEQGDCMVLDLLPASHVVAPNPFGQAEPFCIRVDRDGRIEFITDEEAGLTERPDFLEAMSRGWR
jgi:hypothetical protein